MGRRFPQRKIWTTCIIAVLRNARKRKCVLCLVNWIKHGRVNYGVSSHSHNSLWPSVLHHHRNHGTVLTRCDKNQLSELRLLSVEHWVIACNCLALIRILGVLDLGTKWLPKSVTAASKILIETDKQRLTVYRSSCLNDKSDTWKDCFTRKRFWFSNGGDRRDF